ncbi:aspartate/glutamate racemase family protein [Ancylobacter oerskovii]|uniref:Aspartate/glutamate racemase family protein n=1 Tax=Ancylobacter oerskovii TaxID=459519 RepID=A0ABW4Z2Q5_9HYPH|nr:aspartate/glutamate racemase family protein [Ancylobacter oerskovii]MBS7544763.1 arylsulfatase [Ancylobacter oerskovii]
MTARPRIVLLHATPVAMEPVQQAFSAGWPEAETVNLLDDALSADRARTADITEEMTQRFLALGRYAARIGADGVLVTCSAFGPAIERLAEEMPVPVLKPNEAMFRAAIASGRRIGMLATFAPAVATMTAEFETFVAETDATARLDTLVVADAIDRLRAGDAAAHNALVAARAPELAGHDAIMLAHFSTSRAAEAVRRAVDVPVFTAPDAAVECLRQLIEHAGN